MSLSGSVFLIVFFSVLFIGEIFSFRGIQFLLSQKSSTTQLIVKTIYWLFTISVFILMAYTFLNRGRFADPAFMNTGFVILSLFIINFAFKSIFGGIHFLNEAATFIANVVIPKAGNSGGGMSRSKFLTVSGLALASVPFTGLLYGVIKGRYQFKTFRVPLKLANLPDSFVGKKIVQISDFHLGSFPRGTSEIAHAIEKINALEPDYIFFTGDMVNERAIEAEYWIDEVKKLKAKYGKYSVLGNHDYGDYYEPWQDKPDRIEKNVLHLKQVQKDMGFEMLRNESVLLEQNGETIRLIGLENWGTGRFSKYGDLPKALQGVKDEEVQILLSHDPSHWEEQVLNKTAIDISLAGHTHGSQIGIEIPGLKWSPVKYRYPRWAGLYEEGKQKLYVNRGIGYIGYAGRIGIWPEITLFELEKA